VTIQEWQQQIFSEINNIPNVIIICSSNFNLHELAAKGVVIWGQNYISLEEQPHFVQPAAAKKDVL
jgi:hypothetical protein